MVRIRLKGKPYTNEAGEWRRVYTKNKKEYIIMNKRKKFI